MQSTILLKVNLMKTQVFYFGMYRGEVKHL